eukprot:gene10336-8272_t
MSVTRTCPSFTFKPIPRSGQTAAAEALAQSCFTTSPTDQQPANGSGEEQLPIEGSTASSSSEEPAINFPAGPAARPGPDRPGPSGRGRPGPARPAGPARPGPDRPGPPGQDRPARRPAQARPGSGRPRHGQAQARRRHGPCTARDGIGKGVQGTGTGTASARARNGTERKGDGRQARHRTGTVQTAGKERGKESERNGKGARDEARQGKGTDRNRPDRHCPESNGTGRPARIRPDGKQESNGKDSPARPAGPCRRRPFLVRPGPAGVVGPHGPYGPARARPGPGTAPHLTALATFTATATPNRTAQHRNARNRTEQNRTATARTAPRPETENVVGADYSKVDPDVEHGGSRPVGQEPTQMFGGGPKDIPGSVSSADSKP